MLHRVQPKCEGDFAPNRDMAVSPAFFEGFVQDAQQRGYTFAIYVTTSFPDGEAVLWWYAVERLLRNQDSITLANGRVLPCCTSREKLDAFVFLRESIMALPHDGLGDHVNTMLGKASFDWRQMCA